jgi:hypothetical protein
MLQYADDRMAQLGQNPATANLGGMRAMFKSMVTDLPEAAAMRGLLEKVKTRAELGEHAAAHLAKWGASMEPGAASTE